MGTKSAMTRSFARYVSLNVAGMVGMSAYILADTFFIANGVGPDGLVALNFAIVLYTVMQATGLMIGIGGATEFQVRSSRGDALGANRVFTTALGMAGIAAVAFFALVQIFVDPVSTALGADETTHPLTVLYLRTTFAFAPLFLLNNVLLPFVRNDGSPQLSMVAMLVGSFGNIVLDWVLIFGLGWGMFGAAFATGLAPLMSMLVLSLHFLKRRNSFRPVRMRPSLRTAAHIGALGFSSFVVELSGGLVLLVLNLIILNFEGNTGVAAYGVVANFAFVANSLFVGIAQGIQPLASNAYARASASDARSVLKLALITSVAIAAVVYAGVFLCAEPLALAFNRDNDPQLTALAVDGMRIYFLGYFFAGINIVAAAFFSAVEQPARGLMVSLVRGFVAMLSFAFLLAALFGMAGVWSTFPAAELATFALTAVFLVRFSRVLRTWRAFPAEAQGGDGRALS
ncbi:MATE family efflux transporter [Paraeggerthella hongkongensis]|uniref:MATE family efflux transporter n=1 Tax=Paraeggerthella hongkongensis TaxID=230658 RepID=A0A3N0B366_9ACTN|nr:MATE family efflux transporter [Paraeggerthella hongkongensis]RNL41561.1 MATE family efflux transporter [Paraeggerthella hongkongensis]